MKLRKLSGKIVGRVAPPSETQLPARPPRPIPPSSKHAAKPITVLLADDHPIVRNSLRTLLQLEKDIAVVGEAANGRQAVALTKKLRPAVVVMDITMPVLNGLDATRQIHQAIPATKVLILSTHTDDTCVAQAMALGVAGYLDKQTFARFLPKAIRKIHQGNTFISPEIARNLAQDGKYRSVKGAPEAGGQRLSFARAAGAPPIRG